MTELMNLRDVFVAAREEIVKETHLRGVNLPAQWVAECIFVDYLTANQRQTLHNTFESRAHSVAFILENMK
ncbi:hypothetical protein VPHD480_0254 [Vibrio phage D480]|nr:hypothetical protein MYOV011v1_p0371 [Vibrio phage 6E35.1a]